MMYTQKIDILDSTLRDGAQGEGISFSVEDKLSVVSALDELGVGFIEAGNPASNPKELEFFQKASKLTLHNSKLVAFGSTRRKGCRPEDDKNLSALLAANTEVISIFGKSSLLHVYEILNTTAEENLQMIQDSIRYLRAQGKRVLFDAEHFFDGYQYDSEYAVSTLEAASDAGAECLVLCDTNGGAFPEDVFQITKKMNALFPNRIGIHTHNDKGMAVANSIMAVCAGAVHVQGTYLGFGERCGNANLSTIIPNLQIKGIKCISQDDLELITPIAKRIAEIANISVKKEDPYVGESAFAHKAGMHSDGVLKLSSSFEHIAPEAVGNQRRILLSEITGRGAVLQKIQQLDPNLTKDSDETKKVIEELKRMEQHGYQFEGADASFEMLIRRTIGADKEFFELVKYKIVSETPDDDGLSATATVKVRVGDNTEVVAAEGNGPINALDKALRLALEMFYPELKKVHLIDYKVRVIDSKSATAAVVRVLITSTDGDHVWSTVGVSSDVVEASRVALIESIAYKLIK
ncbi:MAG: citramalate synthase [Bacillota bacterium]|nr:citramalate synthase [Bacillota bacterium]